jgi:hypothetical protein
MIKTEPSIKVWNSRLLKNEKTNERKVKMEPKTITKERLLFVNFDADKNEYSAQTGDGSPSEYTVNSAKLKYAYQHDGVIRVREFSDGSTSIRVVKKKFIFKS